MFLAAGVSAGVGVSSAQSRIHEYIPEPGGSKDLLLLDGQPGADAFMYEGALVEKPKAAGLRPHEQPVRAAASPAAPDQREGQPAGPTYRPDRVTDFEGSAKYYEVFSPSITPYKRTSALDTVVLDADGVTPILVAAPGASRAVPAEGALTPPGDGEPRARFWGSVMVDLSSGGRVPLPSVAPEQRLLTLETSPLVNLRVERDAADNYYAAVQGRRAANLVRVTYLLEAPVAYFGGDVPDVALAERVLPMPASVRKEALAFAAELGLAPGARSRAVLDRLVRHFRSFEESAQPPRATRSIFLDLARGKKGVCRHRAYAFTITARALGLDARFVMNEAHAWVEALVPSYGWIRIDLGGAASALDPRGGEGVPVYRAPNGDPFPKPPEFVNAMNEVREHMRQLGRRGFTEAAAPAAEESSDAASASQGTLDPWGDGADGAGDRSGQGGTESDAAKDAKANGDAPRSASGLTVLVDRPAYDAYRGRTLEVSGRVVEPSGAGVEGLRVELWLDPVRAESALLGVTATGGAGVFQITVGILPAQKPGDYVLRVRTPGNAKFGPAEAR